MTFLEAVAILAAGVWAGAINVVVGSGSLVTFPVLVALGYGPLVANTSNNVGLVFGGLAGVHGYRRELRGQRDRIVRLGLCSALGAAAGAALLLTAPGAFRTIVPAIIAIALALVIARPRLPRLRPLALWVGLVGVYGGYFGGAQGILLIGVLGVSIADTLQRTNALRNVLNVTNNAVAALAFIVFGPLNWGVVGLIAAGSLFGGSVGSRVARRLPDPVMRAVIVVVGVAAIVKLVA